MRISDWSSDVCSSDLHEPRGPGVVRVRRHRKAEGRGAGVVNLDEIPPAVVGAEDAAVMLAPHRLRRGGAGREAVRVLDRGVVDAVGRHVGGGEDRKSTRLNSSTQCGSRMPSSAVKKKQSTE